MTVSLYEHYELLSKLINIIAAVYHSEGHNRYSLAVYHLRRHWHLHLRAPEDNSNLLELSFQYR